MAKDPAFLFYTNDFSSGTQFFTDEQLGKFLRLLMAQHQHGHLSEKQVLIICKSHNEDTQEILRKFEKDDTGLYYNLRLETEINKRKKFSESRSDNRLGKIKPKKKTSKSYVNHMENENEIVNEVKKETKKEVPAEIIFPFNSTSFKGAWLLWKQYKKEQYNFTYKPIGEQAALKDLANISGGNEQTAIKLIENAIAKNWKGIYKTNDKNGQSKFTYEDLLNAAADAGAIYPKS